MVTIDFDNRTPETISSGLTEAITRAVSQAVRTEGIGDEIAVEVSYSMVTPQEIHSLNRDYRKIDRETDVLSFPLNDFSAGDGVIEIEEDMPLELGDIVVNLQRARQQAQEYGHSFDREVVYLSVHSTLHLLGYDHLTAEDKQEMRAREKEIMALLEVE